MKLFLIVTLLGLASSAFAATNATPAQIVVRARELEAKAKVAEEAGDVVSAQEHRAKACATYQTFITFADKTDTSVMPTLRLALLDAIPLLLKTGHSKETRDNCDVFLKTFPSDPSVDKVKPRRNTAVSAEKKDGTNKAKDDTTERKFRNSTL